MVKILQRRDRFPTAIALMFFGALCIAVLTRSTLLIEPDDYAYRASIAALADGHLATLTANEYTALLQRFAGAAQPGIAQWVQLSGGRWISEKNPGYPFFAVPFQLLGILRLAPLFYAGLGCVGLYFGGRRWLGRWGGAAAVTLYCSSGAAMVFAWRATMPTFVDASLIAAGTGALLWTLLATDATARRRTLVGLLAFLALEGATSIRYTNALLLIVAVVAVVLARRRAGLSRGQLVPWLGSVALLAATIATFNAVVYGGVTRTGYSAGEITFALSALVPNLQHMPAHLVSAMPVLVLAVLAALAITVRALRGRRGTDSATVRRDAAVGAALVASWIGIYGLYATYTWTASLSAGAGSTLQVVRFYLPALAAIALLGAWLCTRLPRGLPILAVAGLLALGAMSFTSLADGGLARTGGQGGPAVHSQLGTPPQGGAPPGVGSQSGAPPAGPPPAGLAPQP